MQTRIKLQPDHIYHIYNRGNNYRKIFKERENYFYFLKLMKKYIEPIANIYAYALLPDHFHLLLEIKNQEILDKLNISDSKDISLKFSHWFNAYAKAFNKRHNEISSLFEKGFERSLIRADEQFTRLIYYIHWNPKKHGNSHRIKVSFRINLHY